MPSSLIFVGLVVAWLLILVPIVARRRQEVARPSEAALACRVLERPGVSRRVEEVSGMDEPQLVDDAEDAPADSPEPAAVVVTKPTDTDGWQPAVQSPRQAEPDVVAEAAEAELGAEPHALLDALAEDDDDAAEVEQPVAQPAERSEPRRGYRAGRGGYDPEAALLAARARYQVRQRVVLALVLAAVATAAAAVIADSTMWWVHAGVDLFLVGYLVYLRRQVRLEEGIRQHRAARMAGTRRARTVGEYVAERGTESQAADTATSDPAGSEVEDPALPDLEPLAPAELAQQAPREPERPALPPLRPTPLPPAPEGTTVIDVDDEDPGLHDLADPGSGGYRRAAGE